MIANIKIFFWNFHFSLHRVTSEVSFVLRRPQAEDVAPNPIKQPIVRESPGSPKYRRLPEAS
jgi:hypothetical protein